MGGAQGTNSNTGVLDIGKQADLLVLDPADNQLFANSNSTRMDSMIFASQKNPVRDVMVNGKGHIKNRQHKNEKNSAEAFAELLKTCQKN